ncbi:MAG: adenosylhomocysteinase, partial [Clostridia bacterium]|nr:adenosylhomocysteinase [Clostridia bacterium]
LEYLAKNKGKLEKKLYAVPREIDEAVAAMKLETLGITIDKLTDEQVAYLSKVD